MEYTVPVCPGHILAGPVMAPGFAVALERVTHLGALVELPPQAKAAVTHKLPVLNAGKSMVTFCEPFPVIVAPGKLQVYTVAEGTAAAL